MPTERRGSMLDPRRGQHGLAVLESPRPTFPREVRELINEAVAALVLQVAEAELEEGEDEELEGDDEGAR
jgi:hypothetical protein